MLVGLKYYTGNFHTFKTKIYRIKIIDNSKLDNWVMLFLKN